MRVKVFNQLSNNPKYTKTLEWVKLVTMTGFAQVFVQGISLVSGILVIRMLEPEEYALYTLGNTMLGTMTVLADGGISTGVMSQGGKVWLDRVKLGTVMATGMDLRRKFAVGSLLVSVPVLLYLMRHHNASWLMSVLIILSLIPSFFMALSGTLLQVAPKLRQDIGPLQKNAVILNVGRLLLLALTIFIFPWAFVAILAAGLPQIWGNFNLRKISASYADWHQKPDPEVRNEILKMVRRLLPMGIYTCLSGQITIWLISIFGTTRGVAQLGALDRLSMALSFITILFGTLILPRFSRLPNNSGLLLRRFLQIQAGLLVMSAFIVLTVWLFSTQILMILGPNYAGLTKEVVLKIIISCLGIISASTFSLFTSRSWAINPFISIPVSIASIALGVAFIDVSSLRGVLGLNIMIQLIQVTMNVTYTLIKIRRTNNSTLPTEI
ncbi:lipopolysaccharide biosynthesis protein [Chitinophaga sp. CF418]|uniref:lipopolysaccharide biosynthesis protein n=1 Tax=Chitinophaga sp. CF418 TaxID=1855287 RepID=UPI00091C6506|nr:oligosaccharide flippase family protein [Chitinophaga sp. CF418]SHM79840.1 Membrane protein involved in the export of O-antigen and teichoic acid [Chitinophaga sp. CF418]